MSPTSPPMERESHTEYAVLGALSSAVLAGQSIATLAAQATDLLRSTLGLEVCVLLELLADESWSIRACAGGPELPLREDDLAPLARLALSAPEPLVADLSGEDPIPVSPALRGLGHRTAIGSALVYRAERYGVLLALGPRATPLSGGQSALISTVSRLLACAIAQQSAAGRLSMNAAVQDMLVHVSTFPDALRLLHAAAAPPLNIVQTELWQAELTKPAPQALDRVPSLPQVRARGELRDDTGSPLAGSAGEPMGPKLIRRCAFRTFSGEEPQPFDPAAVDGESAVIQKLAQESTVRWLNAQDATPEIAQWLAKKRAAEPRLRSALLLPLDRSAITHGPVLAVLHLSEQPWLSPDWLRELGRMGDRIGRRVRRNEVVQRVRSTLDDAPIGIADRSLDGRWLRVNEHLCKITGYRAEELVGHPVTAILHPQDAANEVALFDAVRRGELDHYTVEKRYIRKDGSVRWVNLTSSAVRLSSGEPSYCVIVVQDIHARRVAEAQLRESEERFRHILVASPVPLMVYDDQGNVVALSESWSAVTGYNHGDIPTVETWCERAFGTQAKAMLERLAATWKAGSGPLSSEVSIQTKSGERRELLVNSVSLGQDSRGVRLRLAAAADVTSLRRSERELLNANQQKDDFIAMLGHELRNPLATMKHASQVLRDHYESSLVAESDAEPVQRALRALNRHSQHMAKLIDGLLDISRVVRGKIALDAREVDLGVIVGDVLEDLTTSSAAEGLEVLSELRGPNLIVKGDTVRLTQVVEHLLANALKYTHAPGTISVQLDRDDGHVVLRIGDTGEGIDEELMPYLFEPFRQGRQALDRAHGGLGLGLSLVHALVELHHGTIEATSPGAGQGSVFTVRLPAEQVDVNRISEAPETRTNRRIVIIDDNEDAAEMLRFLLKRRGHQVAVAFHGQAGLELIDAFQPDVVLCDIGLPDGLTGFDVAETLRRNPAHRGLRLIALTGYSQAADVERSRAVGFDAHLSKPASLADIEDLL